MKYLLLLSVVVSVATVALAGKWLGKPAAAGMAVKTPPKMLDARPVSGLAHRAMQKPGDVGLEFCDACIQVSLIMIDELLDILANEGIIGGCSTLCGKLPQKLEQEVCNAACVGLGLDEFIHILERTDIDPIYYCELVRLCPIVDCRGSCLSIVSMVVGPTPAALGKTVTANVSFQVFNKTGTGMTRVDIYSRADPKMLPLQNDYLELGYEPGYYEASIGIDTSQATQFWEYRPGVYTVQVWFCEGECGSQHPHSKIYDHQNGTFTLT